MVHWRRIGPDELVLPFDSRLDERERLMQSSARTLAQDALRFSASAETANQPVPSVSMGRFRFYEW